MQEKYFDGLDISSDCYKYLEYLKDKKQTIDETTKYTVEVIVEDGMMLLDN